MDVLLKSLGRFATRVRVMEGHAQGRLGLDAALNRLLQDRGFEFPVERAVYLTVLHRLFESGSDRAGEGWRRDVRVKGVDGLKLHHLYRAMRWLGDNREAVEEALFHRRRDLFSQGPLAFFDTTSLYFEGQGGESLGQFGYSKDHRPDRRFGLSRVCWVADRGMISADTIRELEEQGLEYLLGARLRQQREVRDLVLGCPGRYRQVADNLRVKEVWVKGRRYVVCPNPQEAAKDAADREAIVKALEDQRRQGAKSLVGNRGGFSRSARGR